MHIDPRFQKLGNSFLKNLVPGSFPVTIVAAGAQISSEDELREILLIAKELF